MPQLGVTHYGTILSHGSGTTPSGYLGCDGSSLSRTTYAALFASIGTTFGAADGSHFNLPDLRGMFLRGVDPSGLRDPDYASRTAMNVGGNTLGNVGSVQGHALASHTHNTLYSRTNTSNSSSSGVMNPDSSGDTKATSGPSSTTSTENRPINAYVQFYMKAY